MPNTEHANLCEAVRFANYQLDGGCAEFTVVDQRFSFSITTNVAADADRWLCAGLFEYRSPVMCEDARRLRIVSFGVASHVVAQVVPAFFGNFR